LAEGFAPIEIGLLRRLRAGRRPSPTRRVFFGRRRPTVGRRPFKVEIQALARRASAFDAESKADRRPKGRILEAEFIRRRPLAEGFAPIEIGLARSAQATVGRRPSRSNSFDA